MSAEKPCGNGVNVFLRKVGLTTEIVQENLIEFIESFNWGTQRIMIALLSPSPYIQYLLGTVIGEEWKKIKRSKYDQI